MQKQAQKERIIGMSVCNPVDVDKDYLLFTVDYAGKLGFNHMQVIGPIHHGVKGNIDGVTPYRKYSQFDNSKDMAYLQYSLDAVNAACRKAKQYGIKMYHWHHELELPTDLKDVYPEIVNSYGDIEVSHPLVKDFLENKIIDFFYAYPDMDGLILTLHETKIPLLKLKDQKLGKIERVKYVTKILYDTCRSLGKELIVRPFASLEEDYKMMTKAYEEISPDLLIMDKWTQFDWSLTLPNNAFYSKIKKNPLFVEGDIFGEFFGKGHVPLMLKEHIREKFTYCESFAPKGYVARIDREGQHPFGSVNEVNIVIMNAYLSGKDPDSEIHRFFAEKYPNAAAEVEALMEKTEDILRKTFYLKGVYFTSLSRFPQLNHCKNHYYFEIAREKCEIASNEWFFPKNWHRGTQEELLAEKNAAVKEAAALYDQLTALEHKIEEKEYRKLWTKFLNLKMVTEIWKTLLDTIVAYAKYFDTHQEAYEAEFKANVEKLTKYKEDGIAQLGDAFYGLNCGGGYLGVESNGLFDFIGAFTTDVLKCFELEKQAANAFVADNALIDYVVCGGAMEGHKLRKEVNYSDTLIIDGALCRIPGNSKGMQWSSINAHGWFSYQLRMKPNAENLVKIVMGSTGNELDVCITLDGKKHVIHEAISGKKEFVISHIAESDSVNIQFDKISRNTPFIYSIAVCPAEASV